MFLIPVIPGVPVYICGGVLLPNALMSPAERAATDAAAPPSFWYGVLLACALGILLKFTAIYLQQEVIGRRLGKSVVVRATCRINSPLIRAARFILTQRGLTRDKCIVLVGGPDWPTSVFTGILNLSFFQMALGSITVIILIIPATALGACLTMTNRPGWDVAGNIVTLIAVGTQLFSSLGFAAVIERAAATHATEIALLPLDDEVAALDAASAAHARAYRKAADWRRVGYPTTWLALLATAALISSVACHLAVLVRCFEPVTLADQFDGPPLHGDALKVVRGTPGWFVVSAFVLGSILLYVHSRSVSSYARTLLTPNDASSKASNAASNAASNGGSSKGGSSKGGSSKGGSSASSKVTDRFAASDGVDTGLERGASRVRVEGNGEAHTNSI